VAVAQYVGDRLAHGPGQDLVDRGRQVGDGGVDIHLDPGRCEYPGGAVQLGTQ